MASRPREHGPSRRNPEQALAELRERAAGQTRALASGEDWARWLRIAARFPGWSFTNVMLIVGQWPAATLVAGYDQWQARGRQVRKGEPGIQVIAEPGQPPGAVGQQRAGRAGRGTLRQEAGKPWVAYVWDVSQTTGPPVHDPAEPFPDHSAMLPGLWDALTWLARREGFAVERAVSGDGDGETSWSGHRIRVNAGLDGLAAARALLHELGHVLAHGGAVHVPGESTAGCRGVRKVEADSVTFIVAARLGMDTSLYTWPFVASWAGSDPRARPEETVRAAGSRITQAAAVIISHLDAALFGTSAGDTPAVRAEEPEPGRDVGLGGKQAGAPTEEEIRRALAETERFYRRRLHGSWAPGYLAGRGLGAAAGERWGAGYAPGGWTALTSHLRRRGFGDAVIEAAGLARRSARGTLIDCFRDRVVFAVRDERGRIAGFIGRARPDAGAGAPKYLNSPQTPLYRKGDLLFGLHEGRGLLERGAMPVIVEGPFDAIAVTEAGAGRYVGLAPCGTALSGRQVEALAEVTDLDRVGVLVALDGDRAGREGIVRAYQVLLTHTGRLSAAILPGGRDPAEILQTDGADSLAEALGRTDPLAQVVIDAHLDEWGRRLEHAEGQLAAMRSAATLIARTLPIGTVETIQRITCGRSLSALDDEQRPVVNAELPEIAGQLPAGAICQIVRVADRTGCDYSEVTVEVATAATRESLLPEALTARDPMSDPAHLPRATKSAATAALASTGFPCAALHPRHTSGTSALGVPGIWPPRARAWAGKDVTPVNYRR
ncbi:MAG TPA: toprim domain-containing protein [Streptosporangiaceae bacterium]|nr:toprim domain-containing protein [Streptosporangiaceae bacterium]